MTPFVLFNGELIESSEARIRIDDGGWLHGAGLFETMRAESGRVFRLECHLDRLLRSAAKILFPLDRSILPSAEILSELLTRNRLRAARVRLTVSAGQSVQGDVAGGPKPTVCATASALLAYPPESYEQGGRVAISKARLSPSDPLAGHKTTCYLPRLLALREAQQTGCTEALWFTTANRLAEGSISNVFIVQQDTIKTPPLDTPVLPGIARGLVCELAASEGIEIVECPLTIDDLLDASEVFLTNTIMQVMPVIAVEKHDIGDGHVGPCTRRLLSAYRRRVREECSKS